MTFFNSLSQPEFLEGTSPFLIGTSLLVYVQSALPLCSVKKKKSSNMLS